MRIAVMVGALLLLSPFAEGRKHPPAPEPNGFVIAHVTHFDFGPPMNYYELYLVQATADGSSIERVTLTPPGGSCMQPARVEDTIAVVHQSVRALLEGKNPCSIPEKEVRRELKRCRHCLVFSFATTSIQTRCGMNTRVIKSTVFDKDWFDPSADTPSNTSWTMRLLDRLDGAVGPSVMSKPAFPAADTQKVPAAYQSSGLADVILGKYDSLFQGESDKPSELYRLASKPIPTPDIQIRIDTPVRPPKLVAPIYPPLARIAHVDGIVSVEFVVDKDGGTNSIKILSGPQLLRGTTTDAAQKWKFTPEASGETIHATLNFNSNCSPQN